jgi:hypothetical protein
VDNALRGMWDVFAGNKAVTNFEVPKVASSLDTHVLCEEENDPSLCSVDALHPGAHFTCFTGTTVHILRPAELQCGLSTSVLLALLVQTYTY